MTEISIAIALCINAGALLGLFWKVSRFVARTEFQIDLLWSEYASRHDLAPRDRRGSGQRNQ